MRKATERSMKHSIVPFCLASLVILPSVKADISELKEVPASLTIYAPARNARLERRKVQGKLYDQMPTVNYTYTSVVAAFALPVLFKNAAASFPKGTKLTKFPDIKDDVIQVNLSKQFLQRGFWNSPNRTRLAVYSIVNTTVEGNPVRSVSYRVRLLIDGKPIRNLANVDLRKPLQPRMDMVSQHKAK